MLSLAMNPGDFVQVGAALIEYAGQSVQGSRRREGHQIRLVFDAPRTIPVHREGPQMDADFRARIADLRAARSSALG